jgi:hypothetical protein
LEFTGAIEEDSCAALTPKMTARAETDKRMIRILRRYIVSNSNLLGNAAGEIHKLFS